MGQGKIVQVLELALKMVQPVLVRDFMGVRECIEAKYDPREDRVYLRFDGGEEVEMSPRSYVVIHSIWLG